MLELADNGDPQGTPGEREEAALALLKDLEDVIEEADPSTVRPALQGIIRKVTLTFRQGVVPEGGGKPGAALESLKIELTPEFVSLFSADRRGC